MNRKEQIMRRRIVEAQKRLRSRGQLPDGAALSQYQKENLARRLACRERGVADNMIDLCCILIIEGIVDVTRVTEEEAWALSTSRRQNGSALVYTCGTLRS